MSLVCVRLFGMGDLGRAARWWPAAGRARRGRPLTRRLPRPAGQRTRQRAHPNAVGGGRAAPTGAIPVLPP